MAENETEELLEESSDGALIDEEGDGAGKAEDDSEQEKKKWIPKLNFSKPTIIKIAIGLTVFILGVGVAGYFFFISNDEDPESELPIEAVETDSAIDSDSELIEGALEEEVKIELPEVPIDDSVPSPPVAEGIDKDDSNAESKDEPTDLIEAQEEPSSLEEENLRLKQKISELEANNKSDGAISSKDGNGIVNDQDKAFSIQTESELFMSDFEQELRGYPAVREPNQEPVPEPKWGEFERLNKK